MKFLMVNPSYFDVTYSINRWMPDNIGRVDTVESVSQWMKVHDFISSHAEVTTIPGEQGLPDMVFSANAGFVLDGLATVSNFKCVEREREEGFFANWFSNNVDCAMHMRVPFEGAGDALWDEYSRLTWCGYGFRSDALARTILGTRYGINVVSLGLIDPRFYHLDTCLCPLSSGHVVYYPGAFDAPSLLEIRERVEPSMRIEVYEHEARNFACNGVEVGGYYVAHRLSDSLQRRLCDAGYKPIELELGEFMKSGGSAKCLTLRLDYVSA